MLGFSEERIYSSGGEKRFPAGSASQTYLALRRRRRRKLLGTVQGEEYREQSNTKLTRESVLEAARGSIMDRTGNILVGTTMGFSLELYKTKVDTQTFNNSILNIVRVLEKNGDSYIDTLPISINPFEFKFNSEESAIKWKKNNKIDENATAEQAFYALKDKYEINCDSLEDTRKIMTIVYEIKTSGYSTVKSIEISSSISRASVQEFEERSADFPGIAVIKEPLRDYKSGTLASHIVGYIGKIRDDEYKEKKDTYAMDDYIGRTGIEYVFEEYLKGENGIRQIDMDIDGTQTGEYIAKEAVEGADVVLTIDANLQAVAENALKNNIEKIRNGGFSQRYNAKGGAVVVTNVKTGEVLALVSYPNYSPAEMYNGLTTQRWNEINNDPTLPLYNRAISGSYAPGSTFKMVTAVAALETGVVTKNERINDVGIYRGVPNTAPVCWIWTQSHIGHGRLNIVDAIQKSCNYFFYEMGNRMGIDNLVKYVKYFYPYSRDYTSYTYERIDTIKDRLEIGNAFQYKYLFETDEDKECLDLLFANVDDPNDTVESIINFIISNSGGFNGIESWEDFKNELYNQSLI